MNITRILIIPMFLLSLVAVSGDPVVQTNQPALHTGDVPIGSLGAPVGSYLTIEGLRFDGMKTGFQTLLVDTVNGDKLNKPVAIGVENIDALPKDVRCVLKGYETFQMVGPPPAYFAAAKEAGREVTRPQAGWQVRLFFMATSVVAPKGLTVEKGT
jgi:hypothetical protein